MVVESRPGSGSDTNRNSFTETESASLLILIRTVTDLRTGRPQQTSGQIARSVYQAHRLQFQFIRTVENYKSLERLVELERTQVLQPGVAEVPKATDARLLAEPT